MATIQGGTDTGTQANNLKVNADGSINVDVTAGQPDIAVTGAVAGNTSVALALTGQAFAEFQFVPTVATVTLNFEVSYDSAGTWVPLAVWPLGVTPQGNTVTSLALVASSTEVVYQGGVSGATNIRVRGSGFVAGTVAVTIRASVNAAVLLATAQVNQGTAAATAGAWPVKVTDGTSVQAVKAASTAPLATDPAAVVALSQNSTVVGTAGAAIPANGVIVQGSDGTNSRALATDTSGREITVGAAATGAAVAGSPLLFGGRDASGNALPASVTAAGAAGNSGVVVQGIAGGVAIPVTSTPGNPSNTWPNAPTNIVAANADTALVASNANRKALVVSNDSTAKLYVLVDVGGAGAASATNFSYLVGAGQTLELPVASDIQTPTARIRGFWSAANGTAAITEIT